MPGKVILMGEHAVVYGRPAVVAAVALRLRAELTPGRPGEAVRIRVPALGWDVRAHWPQIRHFAAARRRAWELYQREPTPERFVGLRAGPPWRLVLTALGEAAAALPGQPDLPGATVEVASELPPGAGLGSSAAAAVALVAAVWATWAEPLSWRRVLAVVHEVERRQHGSPSGVDAATVYHGGVVTAQRGDAGLRVEPLAAAPALLGCMRLLDTGRPAESTGEVVARVRARRQEDARAFDAGVREAGRLTEEFAGALRAGDLPAALAAVRAFERWLEGIGVVTGPVRRLVRRIEDAGGAAKVSGAGALSGAGAGTLLALHPQPERLERLLAEEGRVPLAAALGAEGARVEAVARVRADAPASSGGAA